MPRDPITGHLSVSTLGDLQDAGDRLSFHCTETLCGRERGKFGCNLCR